MSRQSRTSCSALSVYAQTGVPAKQSPSRRPALLLSTAVLLERLLEMQSTCVRCWRLPRRSCSTQPLVRQRKRCAVCAGRATFKFKNAECTALKTSMNYVFTCTGDSDDGFWSTSWGRLEKSTLGHVAEPTSFQQKRTLLSARELAEEDWA